MADVGALFRALLNNIDRINPGDAARMPHRGMAPGAGIESAVPPSMGTRPPQDIDRMAGGPNYPVAKVPEYPVATVPDMPTSPSGVSPTAPGRGVNPWMIGGGLAGGGVLAYLLSQLGLGESKPDPRSLILQDRAVTDAAYATRDNMGKMKGDKLKTAMSKRKTAPPAASPEFGAKTAPDKGVPTMSDEEQRKYFNNRESGYGYGGRS